MLKAALDAFLSRPPNNGHLRICPSYLRGSVRSRMAICTAPSFGVLTPGCHLRLCPSYLRGSVRSRMAFASGCFSIPSPERRFWGATNLGCFYIPSPEQRRFLSAELCCSISLRAIRAGIDPRNGGDDPQNRCNARSISTPFAQALINAM